MAGRPGFGGLQVRTFFTIYFPVFFDVFRLPFGVYGLLTGEATVRFWLTFAKAATTSAPDLATRRSALPGGAQRRMFGLNWVGLGFTFIATYPRNGGVWGGLRTVGGFGS